MKVHVLLLLCVTIAACAPAAPQRCQRYDALSLNRENGFAAALDWKTGKTVDTASERIEIALSLVRPVRGPIEVVHVLGDVETDRWTLTPPDQDLLSSSICWITPAGTMPGICGATLQVLPYYPGGYYYLRPNGNTVLEAGVAFFICD